MRDFLVVLVCFGIVMVELLVVLAILAPQAIVRMLRRLDPRRSADRDGRARAANVTRRARA